MQYAVAILGGLGIGLGTAWMSALSDARAEPLRYPAVAPRGPLWGPYLGAIGLGALIVIACGIYLFIHASFPPMGAVIIVAILSNRGFEYLDTVIQRRHKRP